jgi:hypothetical protein
MSRAYSGVVDEYTVMEASVAAGASDTEIALGTITNPKFITMFASGPGLSARLVAVTGDVINVDPFAGMCCDDALPAAQASIFVSNAAAQPRKLTIIAGQ